MRRVKLLWKKKWKSLFRHYYGVAARFSQKNTQDVLTLSGFAVLHRRISHITRQMLLCVRNPLAKTVIGYVVSVSRKFNKNFSLNFLNLPFRILNCPHFHIESSSPNILILPRIEPTHLLIMKRTPYWALCQLHMFYVLFKTATLACFCGFCSKFLVHFLHRSFSKLRKNQKKL